MEFDLETTLLLKEQDELNNWNRIVAQIYYAWYTVFLTFNGAALTWVFSHDANSHYLSNLKYVFLVFALFGILGLCATIAVGFYALKSGNRIREIGGVLSEETNRPPGRKRPQSAIPEQAMKVTYGANCIALSCLTVLWLFLMKA